MKPIQAKIKVQNNKIIKIEHKTGYAEIDLDGYVLHYDNSWVYPGFVDSHGHVAELGSKMNGLFFDGLLSPDDCIAKALKHNKTRGDWLYGRGWNQELWEDIKLPDSKMLDYYFKDIPVCFVRVDGHAAWVNSKALEIAHIDAHTPNPEGGEILRNKNNEPTGILLDYAIELVTNLIPRQTKEQIIQNILTSSNELLKFGITCVHDMDVSPYLIKIYKELDGKKQLPIRIEAFLKAQNDDWINETEIKPVKYNNFNICGLKFYADGALGSRGAALLEPYSDDISTKGLFLISPEELYKKTKKGLESGFFIATHAIGDAANRMVIDVYRKLIDNGFADINSILRIEHSQIVHPDDIKKLAGYPIFISLQPIHYVTDIEMARKRLGDRMNYAYLWKSFLINGSKISAGSDFPIESHNPLLGIDAFVNRNTESLSPVEAISAYTIWANETTVSSNQRGSIEINKDADFTILDTNITSCPKDSIKKAIVLATIVNGIVRYQSDTM